ncbi:MAG TPA: iron ABC transporter permease [Gaiellaceae bacterium]|nr:iron ABC transporter permease [Gaiellaceae bacterium]
MGERVDADRRPLDGVRPRTRPGRTRPGSDPTRVWRALTYGVPLAFLALFFVYPLGAIVERGLLSEGGRSALDVLGDPLTREVLWFTVWQALVSTTLTIAVAFPASYVTGRFSFPGRSLVRALVVVPFVLPTVVVALAFLAVLPESLERGWTPILIAHAFFNVAVVVRIVGTFWASLDRRVSEAAATLGAGPRRRFREVTLPLLAPALAAAAAIVFLFSFTSFGIVLILGGPRYATVEAEIYNQAVRLFDLRAAAVLSLVQLACVALAVWTAMRLEARLVVPGQLRAERDVLRVPRSVGERTLVTASLGGLTVFLGFPLLVLVERSLAVGEGHGLEAYRALARPTSALLAAPWEAVVNSLVYAGGATAIAVVVGGLAAFAVAGARGPRLLDGLLMLPLGASAVMLGFGFVIAFDTAPLDFRSAPWIVPIVQALVAIPFVVRIVAPTLRAIDERQREAAALLGASPGRVRREIDLPIVGRALAVAAGFAFAISLGEFGATVFLARPDNPTLPVAIFRFLGRPGELNAAQAYALAVVLMAVTAASILLVDRVRVRRGGWF